MEQIVDWLNILEQYGIPVVVAIAFGFFIWKQNKFIQDELAKEMRSSFDSLTGILIKLIDQQKVIQLGQKGLERSYKSLVDIITKLYKDKSK